MAEITLPSFSAKSLDIRLVGGDSPLTFLNGSEVVVVGAVSLWTVTLPLSLEAATEEIKRAWRSVLVQLVDLENTFKIGMPDWPGNGAGYAGANPLVKGVGQLGSSLDCDGVSFSTLIALDGDYLEVNGEFKILTADSTSDGAGNVTFNFKPNLRQAPADNAAVDVKTPKITFRSIQPRVGWFVSKPTIYDIALEGLEKFDAL